MRKGRAERHTAGWGRSCCALLRSPNPPFLQWSASWCADLRSATLSTLSVGPYAALLMPLMRVAICWSGRGWVRAQRVCEGVAAPPSANAPPQRAWRDHRHHRAAQRWCSSQFCLPQALAKNRKHTIRSGRSTPRSRGAICHVSVCCSQLASRGAVVLLDERQHQHSPLHVARAWGLLVRRCCRHNPFETGPASSCPL